MSQDTERLPETTRAILHGIKQVFPAQDITNHAGGRMPVSEKKVKRGEADWTTTKEVLGWLLDGDKRTVVSPPDKAAAYTAELQKLLQKKSIPIARFRKIIGKLRFASLCLPAGRALISPLNRELWGNPKVIASGRKSEVHESLGDWLQLIKDLAKHPTSVHELVARAVDFYGYYDACNTGVGGVWLPLDSDVEPFLWQASWLPDIVRRLASYKGLSISDAECAGVVLQQLVLEQEVADLRHKKAVAFCDNTPSVSWVTRMASQQSRVSARLIRGLTIRARAREMCLPSALSVPGDSNTMADVASRSMREESGVVMSDTELLAHFNANFPLSQSRSWRIVTLRHESISNVVSTLRGQRLTMEQWMNLGGAAFGNSGASSRPDGGSRLTSPAAPTATNPQSSARLLTGSGKATLDAAAKSLRSQWIRQSVPLARPSNWLDGETPRKSLEAANVRYNSGSN
ncbi:hypothetical protein ACHAWF_009786 [Thalassiosira exigua]